MNGPILNKGQATQSSCLVTLGIWIVALIYLSVPPSLMAQASGSSGTSAFANTQGAIPTGRVRQLTSALGKPGFTNGLSARKHILEEVGPHSRRWAVSQRDDAKNRSGAAAEADSSKAQHLTEIASGMNFWDGEKWTASQPNFEVNAAGDAFEATKVQHKIRLKGNLNMEKAVTVETPDGIILQSSPVAVGLYDAASGRFQVIGIITNCEPELVSSNQVIYPDAFVGVCADVRYTIERGSFEQDIMFTGSFDPGDYGFPTNTTRVQILTEFYGAPEPDRVRRPIFVEKNAAVRLRKASPDLMDDTLRFGEFVIGTGQAFSNQQGDVSEGMGVVVAKEFRTIAGRTFLIESIEFEAIRASIKALPDCGSSTDRASVKNSEGVQSGYAAIPSHRETQTAKINSRRPTKQFAMSDYAKRPAFVVDYLAGIGPGYTTPLVFQSDTTYFVSGPVYCNSATTIEGGAIFKYPISFGVANPKTAFVQINGTLVCKTSNYRPAIFTAGDDESMGTSLADFVSADGTQSSTYWPDWTGTIQQGQYYANPAIYLNNSSGTLSHVRFLHCQEGVKAWGTPYSSYILNHSQFVNCLRGISCGGCGGCGGTGTFITVNNSLMSHVESPVTTSFNFNYYAYFNQCTFDLSGTTRKLVNGSSSSQGIIYVNNSILANLLTWSSGNISLTPSFSGFVNCNAALNKGGSPVVFTGAGSPFQTMNEGKYYLTDSSGFRHVGSSTAIAAFKTELKTRTTYPPVSLATGLEITAPAILSPQVLRYDGVSAPDLGYYYPALDFTVAQLYLEGSTITVYPGTAIAVRNHIDLDVPFETHAGFILQKNSSFIAHGTPTSPIVFASAALVQEGPFLVQEGNFKRKWAICFLPDFEGDPAGNTVPALSCRFAEFSFTQQDLVLTAGNGDATSAIPYFVDGEYVLSSAMSWGLQDCKVRGGGIFLARPFSPRFLNAGSVSFINTLFDRVTIILKPWDQAHLDIDISFNAFNNLFRGGLFFLYPMPNSRGNWVVRDNLFDNNWLAHDTTLPLDHDDNAYWQTSRLTAVNDDGGIDLVHDQILNAAPSYQSGPFGDFYLPANTLNADHNRTTAQAGLATHTTRYDQAADAANVTIGLHYVATSSGTSKIPKDTDGDLVPDYVADGDGNGVVDSLDNSVRLTTAKNDVFQVQQGSTGNVLPVLLNDTDAEGFPLSLVYPSGSMVTPHGTLLPVIDSRSLLCTPTSTFYGVDTFIYGIVNGVAREASAKATIFINKTGNHAPVALKDQATLSTSSTTVSINLLANDSDVDGDVLTVYSVSAPQLGTVSLTGGTILYTRPAATFGMDVFTYVVTDGKGGCAVGAVTIDRNTGSNHLPVAESYSISAVQGDDLNIQLIASDTDGAPLTYTVLSAPKHGTFSSPMPNLVNVQSGTVPTMVYHQSANYYGPDYLTFKVNDGLADSTVAVIAIHIGASKSGPSATPSSIAAKVNIPIPIKLSGYDSDGDYLFFTRLSNPTHGTLSGASPNLVYTPAVGYTGWDSFTFRANDGYYDSLPATIAINVAPDAPLITVANKDYFEVAQNSAAMTLPVLLNDADSERSPLTITARSTAAHGTVAISADSLSIIYTPSSTSPAGGYYGTDSFTYTISNADGRIATGTVIVFVNKTANNNPGVSDYAVTLPPSVLTTTIAKSALLANCADPDVGDTLAIYSIDTAQMGTVVDNGSGGIVYTRAAGRFGDDSFECVIKDTRGGHSILTVRIDQTDTDGDGFPDSWETTPFNPSLADDVLVDTDEDGLTDLAEFELRSNPRLADNPLNFVLPSGNVLSGMVRIPLNIGTDANRSGGSLALYLNGSRAEHAVVEKDPNGTWKCMLDTTSIPNGMYWLTLGYTCPDSDIALLEANSLSSVIGGESILVTVRNAIWFADNLSSASSTLYYEPQTTNVLGTWIVSIYDDHNSLFASLNGNVDSTGHCLSSGSSLPGIGVSIMGAQQIQLPSSYYRAFFKSYPAATLVQPGGSVTAQAGQGGATVVTTAVETWTTAPGRWLITYEQLFNTSTLAHDILESLMDGTAIPMNDPTGQYQQQYANSGGPVVGVTINGSVPPLVNAASWNVLRANLALDTVRNFVYFGHFSNGRLGGGGADPKSSLSVSSIQKILQNNADAFTPGVNKHPYRFVFINGCNSANSGLPEAFGFTKNSKPMSTYIKANIMPRAFLGWATYKVYGNFNQMDDDLKLFSEQLFLIWPTTVPGSNPSRPHTLQEAVKKAMATPGLGAAFSAPVIYGCPDLLFW